jgi:hypothetical protein
MKTAKRRTTARKPAPPETPPPPPYVDPGWLCRAEDMTAPWDGVSPTWIEREAAQMIQRIDGWQSHPDRPAEAAGPLAQDAKLVLIGLLSRFKSKVEY